MRSQCTEYLQNVKRKQVNLQTVNAEWRRPPRSRMRTCFGSGALRPPPPVAAPLVPRFALLPAATPRLMRACSLHGRSSDSVFPEGNLDRTVKGFRVSFQAIGAVARGDRGGR